jgi:hypothetical protein
MAYFSLVGEQDAFGVGAAIRLQPARFANGPCETQAADKLPHCC